MIYLSIIITLISLFYSIKIFKITSPIIFFCFFNLCQLTTYFLVIKSDNLEYFAKKIPIPTIYTVGTNYLLTCYLFIFFSIIVLIFCTFYSQRKDQIKNTFNQKNNIKFNDTNKYINLLNIFISLIILIFIFDINLYRLYDYIGYLSLNDFNFIEADLLTSKLFLKIIPSFGILSSLGFYTNKDNSFFRLVSLFNFLFLIILSLAMASRLLPLLLLINFVFYFILNNNKKRFNIFLFILIIFIAYLLVLELRSYNELGLSKSFLALKNIIYSNDLIIFDSIKRIFYNLSQGAIIYDLTLEFKPNYDFRYKFLSLIPSISFIDNFYEDYYFLVRDTYRINKINPFNSFGEAYLFGGVYLAFFFFIFLISIFYSTILNEKVSETFLCLPILMSNYFMIIYVTQYNLRNVSRYIYICLFLSLIFNLLYRKFSKPS